MVLLQRKHGYRFSKRPYADEFLMQVSQAGFEVIFYSDLPQAMGMETLNKLINVSCVCLRCYSCSLTCLRSSQGYPPGTVTCSGLLGREHMFFRNGKFVKVGVAVPVMGRGTNLTARPLCAALELFAAGYEQGCHGGCRCRDVHVEPTKHTPCEAIQRARPEGHHASFCRKDDSR